MKNLLRQHFKWQWLACLALSLCFSSCKDENDNSIPSYDPDKPVVLTDFYPAEGKLASQVILNGTNFGNSKENVKVFFNDKEAAVVSVKDSRMLVLAPKRAATVEDPKCVIKVQIQGQDGQYEKTFDYHIQATVTTLVGGTTSSKVNPTGTVSLAEAQFRANIDRNICVDDNQNVFFIVDNDNKFSIFMLNEKSDKLKCLKDNVGSAFGQPVLAYHSINKKLYQFYAGWKSNEIFIYNPQDDYALLQVGNMTWDNQDFNSAGGFFGEITARAGFTMGPDEKMYSRMLGGSLIRVDVNTNKAENLTNSDMVGTKDGTCYGLVFDPNDDNIFYFSNENKHCIYKYDLGTKKWECWAGQEGKSGYLDGPIGQALFNRPGQMCVDSEGNIIFTDIENHCIRKITKSTGYVSTLAGIPQKSGYINGIADKAQFKKPMGICIDADDVMYIGDSENRAIRRLAVE